MLGPSSHGGRMNVVMAFGLQGGAQRVAVGLTFGLETKEGGEIQEQRRAGKLLGDQSHGAVPSAHHARTRASSSPTVTSSAHHREGIQRAQPGGAKGEGVR